MDTIEAIKTRTTTQLFDSTKVLSASVIEELATCALAAPSSYNLQHTRLIVVTEPNEKLKLKAAAREQPKIATAAATFIVLADLEAQEKHEELITRAVAQGALPKNVAAYLLKGASDFYGEYKDHAKVRDEAIRSASLASMNLMLAAHAKGLGSGPMIGFDPGAVKEAFGISDRYLPVMLIAVGYAAPGNFAGKPRLAFDEAVSFNTGRAF